MDSSRGGAGAAEAALALGRALAARRRPTEYRWRYEDGLGLLALDALGDTHPNFRTYVDEALSALVDDTGAIAGYRLEDYNLDQINPGKLLFSRLSGSRGNSYRRALDTLRGQLRTQPRTPSGGFWHKAIYPEQMWLDGLYMAAPFLVRYGKEFHEAEAINEALRQFRLMEEKSRDPLTGLLKHGWDESRRQAWSDKQSGLSPSFWSRSIGWYAMALVDAMSILPGDSEERGVLSPILGRLTRALIAAADRETGLWWQVTDRPGEAGNYLEASASSMFAYALARAVQEGLLTEELRSAAAGAAERAAAELRKRFLFMDEDGWASLGGVCSVAGLGRSGEGGYYRDGSYDYYISEPVVKNDLKGAGPFILAQQAAAQQAAAQQAAEGPRPPRAAAEPAS